MIGVLAWAFTTYIALKGIKNLVSISFPVAVVVGLVAGVVVYVVVRPLIAKKVPYLPPGRDGVNRLFTLPLICAAALLSFAHGANHVANAVGPLAGIVEVLDTGIAGGGAGIPLWVMVTTAVGIDVGLGLFGPKLIRTVGSEITELDCSRAFSIPRTLPPAAPRTSPLLSTNFDATKVWGLVRP